MARGRNRNTLDESERPAQDAVEDAYPASRTAPFSMEKFDKTSMVWTRWQQRLEGAFSIFNVPESKKAHYLLHHMGMETFNILADKVAPQNPYNKTYREIVDILSRHFSPTPLEIAEIFRFHQRKQKSDETVNDYVTALQKLSIHCNFGDYLQKAIRNQFVFGIANDRIQNRLLEIKDLTLDKAVETANAIELSIKDTADMQNKTGNVNLVHSERPKFRSNTNSRGRHISKPSGNFPVRKAYLQPNQQKEGAKNCFRCGKPGHSPENCRHIRAVCKYCRKPGHIDTACFKKNKVNKVSQNAMEEFVAVVEVNSVSNLRTKIYIEPILNNCAVRMELDSGAAISTMNIIEAQQTFPDLKISDSNLTLIAFGEHVSSVLGVTKVKVTFEQQTKILDLYIVEQNHEPLMGREWIRQFHGVDWNKFLEPSADVNALHSPDPNIEVKRLMEKYGLEKPSSSVGKIENIQVRIKLRPDHQPVFCKARPAPFTLLPKIEAEIDRLVADGVYKKVDTSLWATPIVPVAKANQRVRICGDYKITVNPQLIVDDHPLPTVDELFANMKGNHYTKIDLCQAYFHLPVHPDDQHILTLNTHKGLFQPTRLQFGIASAPAIWQRTIEGILAGIEGTKVFLDDIKITAPTHEEHFRRLEEVLRRLQKYNLKINTEKSVFFADEIHYCGYRIDRYGIHKTSEMMGAISNMTRPNSKKDIEVFRGLVGYYSRFIPNYSEIMQPINYLSKENVKFNWDKKCEEAFKKIKAIINSEAVLVHFDPTLELLLATDASPHAVSAVLSHKFPDNSERPIKFASQTLSDTQKKYAHIDKEAYAIIFGIKKFHQYLFGRKFTLIIDCQPLTQIFSPRKGLPVHTASRMQHYAIFL